jgi:hypothetical protein
MISVRVGCRISSLLQYSTWQKCRGVTFGTLMSTADYLTHQITSTQDIDIPKAAKTIGTFSLPRNHVYKARLILKVDSSPTFSTSSPPVTLEHCRSVQHSTHNCSSCFGTLSPPVRFWRKLPPRRTCSGLHARNSLLSEPTLLSAQA